MKLKTAAISSLRTLHGALLLFVLFGWILPYELAWKLHLGFLPALIIHWKTNDNTCVLSDLEAKLLGQQKDEQGEGAFIKSLLSRCFNPLPSDGAIKAGIYLGMASSWCISLLRLCL